MWSLSCEVLPALDESVTPGEQPTAYVARLAHEKSGAALQRIVARGQTCGGAERAAVHDVVVLGAGTGGYSAAFRAAQLGLKVALVDEDRIGGTCLHRGCIPTKAILEAAELAHRVREQGAGLGILVDGVRVDYAATAANKDAVVKRMWTGLKSLVGKNGVEWVGGRGRLDGPGRADGLQACPSQMPKVSGAGDLAPGCPPR